jgi:hypothetical protein
MAIYKGNHDRSKASEHAIVISRVLIVPVSRAGRSVPLAAKALAAKVALVLPAPSRGQTTSPLKLILKPTRQSGDWQIELRLPQPRTCDFFEGDVRLEHADSHSTRVTLLGRFSFESRLLPAYGQSALRALAEENVGRIFDQLIREMAAIASRSH